MSRAKRVNYDDIRIILGGLPWGHEDLMALFEALPYKKLIVTTYDKAPDDDYVVKVKEKIGWTGISFNFKNFKGERFYDKYVDFVSFFNN
ncbi:MAG: DUF1919 domain-containing protein, partial [Clostridia bacterium]|nr:DUF1919 domain-containing protein [Clostridia bacterium]